MISKKVWVSLSAASLLVFCISWSESDVWIQKADENGLYKTHCSVLPVSASCIVLNSKCIGNIDNYNLHVLPDDDNPRLIDACSTLKSKISNSTDQWKLCRISSPLESYEIIQHNGTLLRKVVSIMPRCCVPMCNNTEKSGVKFHRFPADEKKANMWAKRIRRANFVYTTDSRICSYHFDGDVSNGPNRFFWNEKKNFELSGFSTSKPCLGRKKLFKNLKGPTSAENTNRKSPRYRKQTLNLRMRPESTPSEDNINLENSRNERKIFDLEYKLHLAMERISHLEKKIVFMEQKTKTHDLVQNLLNEAQLQVRDKEKQIHHLNSTVLYMKKFESENFSIQFALNQKVETIQKLETSLRISKKTAIHKFVSFEDTDVKMWRSETMTAFTGLQDFSSIKILIDFLDKKRFIYQNGCTELRVLTLSQQVVLFLMKLKLDVPQEVLSYLFKVSKSSVSNIFSSILGAIYEMFYEGLGPLCTIPPRTLNTFSLPKCLKNMPNCRIVIDCTEFRMQSPSTMKEKKLVYSSYKSNHTMKVLIGCAPNGTATFVSCLFGGSESDKSIVIKCGILDEMKPGDLILADKGFQLYDILPPGVSLNIPSFLVNKQFTISETVMNVNYARGRVIIERLNARFKVFRILDCIKASNRRKAEIIVKVCVALTTLMPTLMAELNEII